MVAKYLVYLMSNVCQISGLSNTCQMFAKYLVYLISVTFYCAFWFGIIVQSEIIFLMVTVISPADHASNCPGFSILSCH